MPMSAHCDRHEPIVIGEMFMVSIGVSYQSKLPASGSVDRVQVAWLPALIEPRFQRAILFSVLGNFILVHQKGEIMIFFGTLGTRQSQRQR